jgi:two-component system heavy metal sensor histidine kinase CusS
LKRPASITLRLTALFSLVSTVVLLLLGYLIGAAVEQHFVEQDMAVLTGKLDLTRHALERVRSENDLISIPQQLDDSLVGHQGLALVVVAPDGQKLFATSGAEFPQALLDKPVPVDSLRPVFWKTAGNLPFRGLAALANTGIRDARPAIIAVATDISHHEHFMSSFRITLWSFVVLAALLTGFLGWVAVRRGLDPLQAIRRKADGITAQKLDDRLDVGSVPLELVDLAETLNAMLSRLEGSFRRLSDFSSDLAHELRTPVSNVLTQTQVTLSRPRTPDDYRDVLVSNVEEFERLSRMIADMLFIAKADEGQIVPSREKIELERLAEDLIEFYRLIADEKGVSLSTSGAGLVIGDPLMMRRAISNLLSNAIRHSSNGEAVSIAIEPADTGRIRIIVTNSGETIPPAHLPRLFDRFYRVDPSRHWQGTHSGLGLAIVKSIVEAHGGEVSVVSAEGKTSFVMVIPRGS